MGPFPFFLTFRNAMFTTILTTTYSPMLRVTWDGNAIAIDTIFQSFSATYPMVELHRSSALSFISACWKESSLSCRVALVVGLQIQILLLYVPVVSWRTIVMAIYIQKAISLR